MWGFSSPKDVLEIVLVPIFLAFLGLIAHLITKGWEDRRRDSQTKTELVAEITELVMKTIMAVYLFNTGHLRQSDCDNTLEQELDRIYKNWRVNTCVIGSKVHAYFPEPKKKGDKPLHEKWTDFSERLSAYYENNRKKDDKTYREEEKVKLFEEKTKIIAELLTSKITGFRNGRSMSQDKVNIVRGMYEAFGRGDIPVIIAALDPNVEWWEAENFIYADNNPYKGPQAVLEGVFMRIGSEWDGFTVSPKEVLDAGDTVIGHGYYSGTYKKNGQTVRAQFAHLFSFQDGKIIKFQQYTDTAQFQKAVSEIT